MAGHRQGPLEIGLLAVTGVAPAGANSRIKRADGRRAAGDVASCSTARSIVVLMCASALPVSGSRTRIRRPSPRSAASAGAAAARSVISAWFAAASFVPSAFGGGQSLLFLLCGNLTYRRRRGPGIPQHHSNKDGQAKRLVAGTCAEIANHKLLQSFNPPKFARMGFSETTLLGNSGDPPLCPSRKIIETFRELGKKRAKVAVLTIGLSYAPRRAALTVSENMYTNSKWSSRQAA